MADIENNHKYVHAGYQFMKMGKELMVIGEQLVEDARDKKAADKHVDDAMEVVSKLATAVSKTRKGRHIASLVMALIMEAICMYGVATAINCANAALFGAGIPIWFVVICLSLECLFSRDE